MSLLRSEQLSVSIGTTRICHHLNLACEAGETWGILGRNGMGKTTLLHTLAGLYKPLHGDIFIRQDNIHSLSRRNIAQQLGLLLQHHEDSFPSTVIETVISGRHPHIKPWQWESDADRQIAEQALNDVQLSELALRPINRLSGGERQRVAMATLLTQNPDIMLLDEPNSHLDLKYQLQLLEHFSQLAREQHKLLIMSLHDINLAARFCDKLILMMGDGKVLLGDSEALLNEDNLQQLYDYPVVRHRINNQTVFIPA